MCSYRDANDFVASTNSVVDTSNDNGVYKKCNISNFVVQKHNDCWAACVATIVNYKYSANLSAERVCDVMGIGYDAGATIYQVKSAFGRYSITYTTSTSQLSWKQIKNNIDADKPFCMGLITASNRGHMVTGYGYAYSKKINPMIRHVTVWEPNGNIMFVQYKDTNTTMTIAGYNYTWVTSVY